MTESLFDRHENLYWHDLNRPVTGGGTEVYIQDFHKQLVNRYRETVQLRQDLAAQRLDVEVARQGFNLLLRCFERLLGESHLHYWLARAYSKLNPEKSSNRYFISFHFCALDAAWHFLDIKNIDNWKDVSILNALRKPELLPWKVGIEELAHVADRNEDRLPELDGKYLFALQSEMGLACKLLTGHEHAEIKPEELHGGSDSLDVILGEEGLKIQAIAKSNDTADDRMRAIYDIDRRSLAWNSPEWASLLTVTDAAIRRTAFWKEVRPKDIKAAKELEEDEDD